VPLDQLRRQVTDIQHLMSDLMQDGEHYGVIPGTGDKPSLLKPGAEKLCFAFRLEPRYEVTRREIERDDVPAGHREYEVLCTLYHIESGKRFGQGVGLCSTMESKYRYRKDDRATGVSVPQTYWDNRQTSILRSALDQADVDVPDDASIGTTKENGSWQISIRTKSENPDIADVYNTVLKMAKKRAHVDAVLTATAASDIFTQDVEDMPQFGRSPSGTSQSTQSSAASSRDGMSSNHGSSSPESGPTEKQIEFVEDLMASSVWSDEERQGIQQRLDNYSRSKVSKMIDSLQETIEKRKAEQKKETTADETEWEHAGEEQKSQPAKGFEDVEDDLPF
jgi:hypothetical protein